ncbi:hypothetical protein DL96DRAFT_1703782 [Flagelloscypha sp. PMI_526]|nr:hypothetical protein DL96DRAFT_1703782 [Flagelloscypha sp. PMI_526]
MTQLTLETEHRGAELPLDLVRIILEISIFEKYVQPKTAILVCKTFQSWTNPHIYCIVTLRKPESCVKLFEELQDPESGVTLHLRQHTRLLRFSLSTGDSQKDPARFARYARVIISACSNITSFAFWSPEIFQPAPTQVHPASPTPQELQSNLQELTTSSLAELLLSRPLQRIQMQAFGQFYQEIISLAPSMATQLTHLDVPQISLENLKNFPLITHVMLYGGSGWGGEVLDKHEAQIEYLVSLKRLIVCIFIVDNSSQEPTAYKRLEKVGISTTKVYAVAPDLNWTEDWDAPYRRQAEDDLFTIAERAVRLREKE